MPAKKRKKKTPLKRKKAPARKKLIKKRPAKRKPAKKVARKKPAPKKAKLKKSKEPVIGTITHYFPQVRAAVIKLKMPLAIGDSIKIKGHTTDFTQAITSMQIDHVPINQAKKGDEIGLLVDSRVRKKDSVYKA